MRFKDLTGETFEGLHVVSHAGSKKGLHYWVCECQCGITLTVSSSYLSPYSFSQKTRCSRACTKPWRRPRVAHGMTGTRPYRIWSGMVQRCSNPLSASYHNYGGRGIKCCDRWLTFENFWADMSDGYKEGLQIDRIDNEGDYTPGNCQWLTRSDNNRKRRNNHVIPTPWGSITMTEASERSGISPQTLTYRVRTWPESRWFEPTKPVRQLFKDTGVGVRWCRTRKRWIAHIKIRGRGYARRFINKKDAIAWRENAEKENGWT
jgi:hypothetical protein